MHFHSNDNTMCWCPILKSNRDLFQYGGRAEFYGFSFEKQRSEIHFLLASRTFRWHLRRVLFCKWGLKTGILKTKCTPVKFVTKKASIRWENLFVLFLLSVADPTKAEIIDFWLLIKLEIYRSSVLQIHLRSSKIQNWLCCSTYSSIYLLTYDY